MELSYIPSKLAKGDATLFDNRNIHITMYNDPEKWQALIQACLSHWIDKYGLNAVRRWKFTVFSMNYTEMTDPPLTREEHSEMFAAVYHTLKTIDPELQLGGGGCFPEFHSSTTTGTSPQPICSSIRWSLSRKCRVKSRSLLKTEGADT